MTVQREAQSTTPSPRNAPPLADRDRLVEIVQRFQWNRTMDDLVDALLAEGVTLPPEKAGPVTSEEAAEAYIKASGEFCKRTDTVYWEDVAAAIDAAMPLLARDHGLLTREEVERRAREWCRAQYGGMIYGGAIADSLLTALTRPAPGGSNG